MNMYVYECVHWKWPSRFLNCKYSPAPAPALYSVCPWGDLAETWCCNRVISTNSYRIAASLINPFLQIHTLRNVLIANYYAN